MFLGDLAGKGLEAGFKKAADATKKTIRSKGLVAKEMAGEGIGKNIKGGGKDSSGEPEFITKKVMRGSDPRQGYEYVTIRNPKYQGKKSSEEEEKTAAEKRADDKRSRQDKYLSDAEAGIKKFAGLAEDQWKTYKDAQGRLLGEAEDRAKEYGAISRDQWDAYKKHAQPGMERLVPAAEEADARAIKRFDRELARHGRELDGYFGRVRDMQGRIDKYSGAIDRFSKEADEYDSAGRIAMEEGRAASDVAQSYGRQRAGLMNMLGRYGMRPGSGKFAGAMRSLALGQAGDTAGAMTGARTGVLNRGIALREAALGHRGRGIAARAGGLSALGAGLGASRASIGTIAQAQQSSMANRLSALNLWRGVGSEAMRGVGATSGLYAGLHDQMLGVGSEAMRNTGLAGSMYGGLHKDLLGAELEREGIAADERMNKYAADKGVSAARTSGKYSAAGTAIGMLGLAFALGSDRRLKREIKPIGELPDDLTVYEFEYIDEPGTKYTGLMADEVHKVMPEHVYHDENGINYVDYGGVLRDLMQERI
ncbi:tail fiber domain-containing protein [Candidatus Poriferisocius sp.]|uniref:tail fiber domain-containing protein n=1 Tax=Candidatus Poriferisocius sp. TaxID=3101276 RepID=UPI003B01DC11